MVVRMSSPTITAPASPSLVVAALRSAVAAFTATQWWRVPGAEEAELMAEVESVSRQLEFGKVLMVADVDARGVAETQARLCTTTFLRERLRLSPSEATARVRAARELTATVSPSGEVGAAVLPATAAGMAAGVLSAEHAQVISRAIRRLPTGLDPTARADVEAALAAYARDADPTQLAIAGRRAHAMLDPDGSIADDKPSRRDLTFVRDLDGTDLIRGRLEAEGSAIVRAAIDALAAPAPAVDGERDPRSPGRRRAEAFIEICRRFLTGGAAPTQGGEKPHVTVTVSFRDLQLGLAGHLDAGQPVTAETVRRLACDASIIPMVLGSRSEPLDVGRATRTIPPAIRRAVTARDIGCVHPGCDTAAAWCDIHHVTHWADGGPTALHNLTLLCAKHHWTIHHTDWEIAFIRGIPHLIPPKIIDPEQRPRRNTLHDPPIFPDG